MTSPSAFRLWTSGAFLVSYLAFIFAITLSPVPIDQGETRAITRLLGILHKRGLPPWFGYRWLEFSANIAMFVPLGFLVALSLPRRTWAWSLIIIPALSGAVEWAQGQFLPARFASVADVAANTIGGYLGIIVAMGFRAMIHARDRLIIASALPDAAGQRSSHTVGSFVSTESNVK